MELQNRAAQVVKAKGAVDPVQDAEAVSVDQIVAGGPRGAIALCVVSVAVVLAVWLAFYFFVFLPRGTIG